MKDWIWMLARGRRTQHKLSRLALLCGLTLWTLPCSLYAQFAKPPSPPPPAIAGDKGKIDRALRHIAEFLTDMNGPVGRVYFPAISVNPNAGNTYGALPVWLLTDNRKEITHIIAPMVTYNKTFGPAFSGTYYYYPSDRSKLRVLLEKAAKSNYRAAFNHESLRFLNRNCLLRTDLNYESDGTQRFFGFGSNSRKGSESSYRLIEKSAQAVIGLKFWKFCRLMLGWRLRRTEVLPGIIKTPGTLPPELLSATTYSIPKAAVFWDSRDYPATPNRGGYAEAFVEYSDRSLGGPSAYRKYGGQWRMYLPTTRSLTTALHAQTEWLEGTNVPFTALASLGGPRSLRGFAEGRFVDKGSFFVNLEERWTLYRMGIVNTVTEFQVAPFLDVGSVFRSRTDIRSKDIQTVAGVAMRAVVQPSVVGRVEVGAGREGPALYVGIDYPF